MQALALIRQVEDLIRMEISGIDQSWIDWSTDSKKVHVSG